MAGMNPALNQASFARDARKVARDLLGCVLIYTSSEGQAGGIIVETEAYLGAKDPASHGFRGPTKRNAVMFGPAAHAYIYFTYGLHYCFNVVTGANGVGEAVLIRALEPTIGLELMQARRGHVDERQLANGPAKLVQALGITKADYGRSVLAPPLMVASGSKPHHITSSPRIGISQAQTKPWRYYITDNPYVSRTRSRTSR